MDVFAELAERIIKAQETVIGPIAIEQADKVTGLKLNWPQHQIAFDGDKKMILENLVEQYQSLFGLASVEVCRDAVREIISTLPKDQVPPLLLS